MYLLEFDPPLYLLFQIGNSIQQLNRKAERQLGLSLVQWYLLARLVDLPATSPQTLATAVGVQPSTLTQTMKRLEKKRLIFVCEDPKDSRKKVVSITREGKNALDIATDRIHEWSEGLLEFSNELSRIQKFLQALK